MLELQPALAGTVGHRFHAAVILVTRTIEHDLRDPRLLRPRGDPLADLERLLRLLPLARPSDRVTVSSVRLAASSTIWA